MYDKNRPMVVELSYDAGDTDAVNALPFKIEEAISKGSAVLVRGWEPTPARNFTVEDLRMYRPSLWQSVEVQGTWSCHTRWPASNNSTGITDAVTRGAEQKKGDECDTSKIHVSMSIERFIALANDPDSCMNLLDLPNLQPDVPMFIRSVWRDVPERKRETES